MRRRLLRLLGGKKYIVKNHPLHESNFRFIAEPGKTYTVKMQYDATVSAVKTSFDGNWRIDIRRVYATSQLPEIGFLLKYNTPVGTVINARGGEDVFTNPHDVNITIIYLLSVVNMEVVNLDARITVIEE